MSIDEIDEEIRKLQMDHDNLIKISAVDLSEGIDKVKGPSSTIDLNTHFSTSPSCHKTAEDHFVSFHFVSFFASQSIPGAEDLLVNLIIKSYHT